jgi:hypothetical protein
MQPVATYPDLVTDQANCYSTECCVHTAVESYLSQPPTMSMRCYPPSGWGKYEPAVRRWEALTRPAPEPTELDSSGVKARIRAEFSEWMMGWPAGWVTGLPLSRTEKLVAIGNGVVPQQAEAAIRWLLNVSEAVA